MVDLDGFCLGLGPEEWKPARQGVGIADEDLQLGGGLDGVPGRVLHHTLVTGLVLLVPDRFDPQDRSSWHVEDHETRVATDPPVVLPPLDLGLGGPRGTASEGGHMIAHDALVPGVFLELWRIICVDDREDGGQQEQQYGRQQQGGRGGASRGGSGPHPAPCFVLVHPLAVVLPCGAAAAFAMSLAHVSTEATSSLFT